MTLKIGTMIIKDCENGASINGDNVEIDFMDISNTKGQAFVYNSQAVAFEKIKFENDAQKDALKATIEELKKLKPEEITDAKAKSIFDANNLSKWITVGTNLVGLAHNLSKILL
ncbi:TPA: hypothetical protein R2K43_000828 [Raoultella planticola]|uniref:hypothetical protein n=1 Tax=Raoultella planticola TaxID=575 RepID=UPI000B9FF8A6|nr:hypothetical protein [Raoultella planticola]OZP75890.1 hypothetical protein CIG23_03545 [Raoultella planticola]HEC2625671.1 hypothetical protein [Raoultella planticola]